MVSWYGLWKGPACPRLCGLVWVRKVHVGEVDPDEERLVGILLPLDEVHRAIRDVIVNRDHARFGQGASVLADLLADFPEARIDSGVVVVGSLAVHDATRAVLC